MSNRQPLCHACFLNKIILINDDDDDNDDDDKLVNIDTSNVD